MTNPTIPHGTKDQDMSEELKLCPFCNQAARAVPDSEHATAYTLQHHSKGCPIDDLWDWYPDEAQAIAAWNQRATPHLDVDQLANIIRAVDGDNTMGAGELAEAIVTSLEGYDHVEN